MSTDETVCAFHQFGHCKFGSNCHKKHTTDTCPNYPCSVNDCPKRHPRPCKYFVVTGFCKFNDTCSFLHAANKSEKDLEKQVANLKCEVEALKVEISEMKILLQEISLKESRKQVSSPAVSHPSNHLASSSSRPTSTILTVVSESDPHPPDENNIPQYDGPNISMDLATSLETNSMESFDCEFCDQTFETKGELKEHNDSHEFCCEECQICYKTQLESDLHELEVHPGTHYANNYISHSSKILFAKNKGIIL